VVQSPSIEFTGNGYDNWFATIDKIEKHFELNKWIVECWINRLFEVTQFKLTWPFTYSQGGFVLEFGWINLFGAVIVTVMLIPNIVYALRTKDSVNKCKSRIMNLTEQIGRYGCMTLMWLPLLVWKFGFLNVEEMLVYVVGNLGLTVAYIIIWIPYFKRKTLGKAIALAVIPTCIFCWAVCC